MKIPVRIEAADEAAPPVEYRWDADTEILSAQVKHVDAGKGVSGSMELEGADGSWLIQDLTSGRINGVEVLRYENPQLDPTDADAKALMDRGAPLQLSFGHIALQAESQPIWFRNIRIKPLTK